MLANNTDNFEQIFRLSAGLDSKPIFIITNRCVKASFE